MNTKYHMYLFMQYKLSRIYLEYDFKCLRLFVISVSNIYTYFQMPIYCHQC